MDAESSGNEIMTLSEVAAYLQLAERTVLRMAQRGEIPAAKVASQWRFLRPLVREWLVARMQTVSPGQLPSEAGGGGGLLTLTELLRPELMSFDLKSGPKDAVLRRLIAPLGRTGFAADPSRLLGELLARERMMTTAVGHGVALPHPRRPIVGMFPEPAVAVGVCPDGTDFDAIDDRRVHVLFLICATRDPIHLQLMAKVSWLARHDVAEKLGRCTAPDEVMNAIPESIGGL